MSRGTHEALFYSFSSTWPFSLIAIELHAISAAALRFDTIDKYIVGPESWVASAFMTWQLSNKESWTGLTPCPTSDVHLSGGPNGKHFTPSWQEEGREEGLFFSQGDRAWKPGTQLAGQKCCALLIKSNVIQFHYTRPEMCAIHIYISNCYRGCQGAGSSRSTPETPPSFARSILQCPAPSFSSVFVICICFIFQPAAHFECGPLAKWQQK